MTDIKKRMKRDFDAAAGLIYFMLVFFIVAGCVDIGYLNAQRYNMEKGLEVAALTGVQGLPNIHVARHLTLNVANSQGLALHPHEILIDPNGQWIQIDKRASYETMFLRHIGIRQIAYNVHVFDF